jgi:acyl-CoA synthetase (AMP-forming)/AMP-acid ligase II
MALLDDAGNLAAFVTRWATRDPLRVALRFETARDVDGNALHPAQSRVLRYGELCAWGARLGRVLDDHCARTGGLMGKRVLILVPVSPLLYPLLYGVMAAGGTAVILDPAMPRPALRDAMGQARCDVVVAVARGHLLRLLPELRPAHRFVVGPVPVWARPVVGPRLDVLADALGDDVDVAGPRPVDVDDDALLTFTSGSTGTVKGARRSHRRLNAQGDLINKAWPRARGDVDVATLPVFATTNLAAGITTVFADVDLGRVDLDEDQASRVLAQLQRHGATSFGGAPAFVDAVARAALRAARDGECVLPAVRAVAIGGAPVSPDVAARASAAFAAARVVVVYGATEAEPIASVSANDVANSADVYNAGGGVLVGAPYDGVRVFIDVDAGDGVADVGEVCVAGDHVLDRYVNAADSDAARVVVGDRVFWRTGDVARRDAHGRLWLLGRKREAVAAAGRRGRVVWPLAVEAQAAALGVRGALIARRGRACFVIEGDQTLAPLLAPLLGDVVDDVCAVKRLPTDTRHRSRIDRRRLQEELAP